MKDTYRGILRGHEWQSPFVLDAVAPSGRRPLPIETKSSRDDYVEGKPIAVQFSYPVHFIQHGKRTTVGARVRNSAPIMLKTTDERPELAFRIRPILGNGDPLHVVHFDDALWWSLPGAPTVQRFAAALTEGEYAAVGLLDPESVSTMRPVGSVAELQAREISYDGLADCIVRLQRGAARILVADNRVFVRDGAPVYMLWNGYINGSITAVGVSDVVGELASSRSNPAFEDASNELVFGRVFKATDHVCALDFARENGLKLNKASTIEVLGPELLQNDAMHIQLEATLSKLLRLISIFRAGTQEGSAEIIVERDRLRKVLAGEASISDCAQHLVQFFHWVAGEPQAWKKKFRVERLFVHDAMDRIEAECIRRGFISPFSKSILDAEDDAAIANLGVGS